jgi:hypothetical protein
MLAAGGGALIGVTAADDADHVARLEAEARALGSRVAQARAEAARLRTERNRLEAQLAAGKAPPICPRPFTSSGDLFPYFTVEYPCGWSVVGHIGALGGGDAREGLLVDLSLFAQLPVSLAGAGGDSPIADIEVADWRDDPSDEDDRLPPVEQWIQDERARFVEEPNETRFEAGGGVTVTRLTGTEIANDQEHVVEVLLWEYTDVFTGGGHVVRAYAAEPGARARAALDRLARTFEVVTR